MSTFTQWNGPQGASGPSAKDITSLIDAYSNLTAKLSAHIEAAAPTDTAVHGIFNYVKDIKSQLEALIGAKAEVTALNSVRDTAEAAATKDALNTAISSIEKLITVKADISTLDSKVDKTSFETLNKQTISLIESFDNLKAAYDKLSGHVTDTDIQLAFDCAVKAATYLIGKIKAFKIIDFTKWSHFAAPYAGTGSLSDTSTNGAFILGCLSLDWSDDDNAPAEEHSHKAARAYIKYVNSNPFDAIIDMAAAKTDDGYVGSLSVHLAKKSGSWKDLAFHLIKGTNSKHTECVYLAVSSKGLASTSADYSNTNFRACGENFIPVGEEGYITPTGMLEGITTATIGTNASSVNSMDVAKFNEVWSSKYNDSEGFNLLRVVSTIDTEDETTYRQVFIGDANHDEITFIKRPSMIVETEEGEQVQAYFTTARDITNVTLPVGSIIRWAPENDDGSLKNIPAGYLACDGSQVSNLDYPELCELLGYDELGMSTLPNESHSIIKAVFFKIIDKASQPDYDELIKFSMLNKKINKEIVRATEAESGLSERINDNAENIEVNTAAILENSSAIKSETTRATEAENKLTEDLAAETTRATKAENKLTEDLAAETTRATEAEEKLTADFIAEQAKTSAAHDKFTTDIAAETTRATEAENKLTEDLAAETERAIAAEGNNAAAIASETSRAIEAETKINERVDHFEVMENRIQDNINAEKDRAEAAETTLQGNIDAEATRATEAETTLQMNIDAEKDRAEAAETTLQGNIDAEKDRATEAETALQGNIDAEKDRATEAETVLQGNIDAEQTRAEAAETTLQDNINAEKDRAEAAETTLQDNINAEKDRAEAAETTLQDNINAEKDRAEAAEAAEQAERSAQDTEITKSVAAETQRAQKAEQSLSERINELHQ